MNPKRQSLDALTGLRFVAAFVVLMAHTVTVASREQVSLAHLSMNAVSFFFVLSGFILTYVYFDRLTSQNVFSFYRARWARIWPLHAACLIFAVAVWLLCSGQYLNWTLLSKMLLSHFTLTQSWLPWSGLANWFNGPAWSVSTELGFYVFFPFLLWMTRKRFWPMLLVVAAITIAALWIVQFYVVPNSSMQTTRYFLYVNPICRLSDFVVGILFGRIFLTISKSNPSSLAPSVYSWRMLRDTLLEIAAIGAICISLYLFSNEGPVSHLFGKGTNVLQTWLKFGAGSSLSFAVCLLVFGLTGGLLSKVLSSRTAVYLGEISYALYLVQSPVLETIKELPATAYSSPIVIFLAANAICFCLAIFLHHLVENPFRRLIISRSRTERWQHAGSDRDTHGSDDDPQDR